MNVRLQNVGAGKQRNQIVMHARRVKRPQTQPFQPADVCQSFNQLCEIGIIRNINAGQPDFGISLINQFSGVMQDFCAGR